MGRKATIDQRDIARAREGLRADGLPHGIIAIRNRLGRGSPQLIARFLSELDTNAPGHLGMKAVERHLDEARRKVREREAQIERLRGEITGSERTAATARAENKTLVATLQRELNLQRAMFEAWRGEQVRDRAMLAARIDQLTRTLAKPSPRPDSAADGENGQQLDLYGEPAARD